MSDISSLRKCVMPSAWMLLNSALKSADCVSGAYITGCRNKWKIQAVIEAIGLNTDNLETFLNDLVPNNVLMIDDIGKWRSLNPDHLKLTSSFAHGFVAALALSRPETDELSVLFVSTNGFHQALSPAQLYVFQMHAAQLAILTDAYVPKTENAASVRLRLLESVVVTANDAILVTEAEPIDLPGPRIVYCNRAFERTTGYTEADVLGLTPRLLQAPSTDKNALARLKSALQAWQPVEVELLNLRKDGTPFWVELSIVPVANDKGWFTHWVSVQRDVSDRKIAEETAVRILVAEAENKAFEAEISRRKLIEAKLAYDASHDDLTKLYNRAFFMDQLAAALRDRRRPKEKTVLFLDLDGFKIVNDSLGHRTGDLLLVTLAERLKQCLRPDDLVARIGGDEFAILLSHGGLNAGQAIAKRIIAHIETPVLLGDQRIFTSCSVGIAATDEGDIQPDVLLRNADIAMYEAKMRGAGGYTVFTPSMHSEVSDSLTLRTDLREALHRGEFYLHYQTICDPISGELKGIEALIRWHHPTRGNVPPLTFIPLAEEIDIIGDIGRWVLTEACTQFVCWDKTYGMANLRISVNVSGDDLRRAEFISNLSVCLSNTGLSPSQLQLEITESVFLRHPEVISGVLLSIRNLGVKIALDDFGTGFSSLGYIDQYEIDCIKIDRSFVNRMTTVARTAAIVKTIIMLCISLDLEVVAEGVETEAQCDLLVELGCNAVQGYLFAKPMPAYQIVLRYFSEKTTDFVREDARS